MKLGFLGLGRMGFNMVQRLLENQHEVVAYNRSFDKTLEIEKHGAIAVKTIDEVIAKLTEPRIIWVMLPSGDITENVLIELSQKLNPNDIVIDGGNAFYKDSIRRQEMFAKHNIKFLDIGVSGGIWGLTRGYCMMIGGDKNVFTNIEPLLKSLAPENGYLHVGPSGSGHYVKMIHNGIEYAMLQAYGEGFDILHSKKEFNLDLEKISKLWNNGSVIESWLLKLAENIFVNDNNLNNIAGYVEDSGEGRWTIKEAIDLDVPAPAISLSLFERFHSRKQETFSAKVIAALRKEFGGHKTFDKK